MTTDYTVQEGDCIDSIALRNGFSPETLWEHPENRELKNLRKDPNILQPGDLVHIPELREGEESCATEVKHTFRRKGVPAKLRMVFYRPAPPEEEDSDSDSGSGSTGEGDSRDAASVFEESEETQSEVPVEPIRDEACIIDIDGVLTESRSDGEGLVEMSIPPDARSGSVKFFAGTADECCFPIQLGEMDSIDTVVGVRKRLHNLGYGCPAEGEEMDAVLQDAIMRFQIANDLESNGEMDQATKDKLVDVHGS